MGVVGSGARRPGAGPAGAGPTIWGGACLGEAEAAGGGARRLEAGPTTCGGARRLGAGPEARWGRRGEDSLALPAGTACSVAVSLLGAPRPPEPTQAPLWGGQLPGATLLGCAMAAAAGALRSPRSRPAHHTPPRPGPPALKCALLPLGLCPPGAESSVRASLPCGGPSRLLQAASLPPSSLRGTVTPVCACGRRGQARLRGAVAGPGRPGEAVTAAVSQCPGSGRGCLPAGHSWAAAEAAGSTRAASTAWRPAAPPHLASPPLLVASKSLSPRQGDPVSGWQPVLLSPRPAGLALGPSELTIMGFCCRYSAFSGPATRHAGLRSRVSQASTCTGIAWRFC